MGRKKEIYGDVRFFHGAIQLQLHRFAHHLKLLFLTSSSYHRLVVSTRLPSH